MGILKKQTRWLEETKDPEETIIDAATEAAQDHWRNGYTDLARRDLLDAKKSVTKYRNRHAGTNAPTLTSSPVYFTGETMQDESGNSYEVMQMSDGTQYGCPPYARDEMTDEMNEYRRTRSKSEGGDIAWEIVIMLVIAIVLIAVTRGIGAF